MHGFLTPKDFEPQFMRWGIRARVEAGGV